VEWEYKQEDVRVSMVTPAVKHALDNLPKQGLVVQQLLTPDGEDTAVGVLALYNVEGEYKQEDVRVSMVTPAVKHAMDHLPKHDLVVQQSLTQDGVVMEHGVRVL